MSDEIIQPKEFLKEPAPKFMRPCDYGLQIAVTALETQLGTIEAYNRLVEAASELRGKIEGGNAQPPNPCYLNSAKGNFGKPKVEWITPPATAHSPC